MARLLALLLLVTSGCSFVLVKGPPTVPTKRTIDCTTSRSWPLVDTAMTVATAAVGVTVLVLGLSDEDSTKMAIGGGTAVLAVPYAIGAVSGFKKTTQCRVYQRILRVMPAAIPGG